MSLSDLPGKDFGQLLFFDIAAKESLGFGSTGQRLLVLILLGLDLLSIFLWGHFDIFQYFFTYFFLAFHNNFWVLDPILEANYKRYVRVIEVKDLLALSHLRHADSFCFYYCSALGENVETFDHSLHSLYSYHFGFAAYFIFHPLLMNCLFLVVKV